MLVWDHGNEQHAIRHDVSREEIDAMYELGEWTVRDDPQGRLGQERLIGRTPEGRFITLAVEWLTERRAYRPISSWGAEPSERKEWEREFFGED